MDEWVAALCDGDRETQDRYVFGSLRSIRAEWFVQGDVLTFRGSPAAAVDS